VIRPRDVAVGLIAPMAPPVTGGGALPMRRATTARILKNPKSRRLGDFLNRPAIPFRDGFGFVWPMRISGETAFFGMRKEFLSKKGGHWQNYEVDGIFSSGLGLGRHSLASGEIRRSHG
jgi:hypothetical protein